MRLWGIIRRNQKTTAQAVSDTQHQGDWNEKDLHGALETLCLELDLSRPVVLFKHAQEMNKFGRTVFKSPDFIEWVDFDSFEVELLDDKRMKDKLSEMNL